jgi:hypothetical protein
VSAIGFIGSRDYEHCRLVQEHVHKLAASDVVVTGAWWTEGPDAMLDPTRGVDRAAAMAAREHGLVTVLVAGSPRQGAMAGVQRNPTIIDLSDHVVAYWTGLSKGTSRGIKLALAAGKLRRLYGPNGKLIGDGKAVADWFNERQPA